MPTFLQTKAFICRTYTYSSNYASDIDRHSSAYLCTKTFTYTTEYTRYISNSSRTTITLRINVDKYIPTYKIYRACIPRFFYPRTRKSAPATVTSQEVPVPLEDQARQATHLQTNQSVDRSRLNQYCYIEPRCISGGTTCYVPISSRTKITSYNTDILLYYIFCNAYKYIPASLRTKATFCRIEIYLVKCISNIDRHSSTYLCTVIRNAWYFKIFLRTKIIFQYVYIWCNTDKYIPTFLQTKAFICRTYTYSSNYASDIDRHSFAYLCTKTFTYIVEYTRYTSNSSRTKITLHINVDKYIPTYKIYHACIPRFFHKIHHACILRFFYPRTRKSALATVTSQEVPVPLGVVEDQARQAIHLQTNQPADRSRLKRFGVHAAKKNLDTNVLLKLRADSHCAKDARYKLTAMLAKSSDEPME